VHRDLVLASGSRLTRKKAGAFDLSQSVAKEKIL